MQSQWMQYSWAKSIEIYRRSTTVSGLVKTVERDHYFQNLLTELFDRRRRTSCVFARNSSMWYNNRTIRHLLFGRLNFMQLCMSRINRGTTNSPPNSEQPHIQWTLKTKFNILLVGKIPFRTSNNDYRRPTADSINEFRSSTLSYQVWSMKFNEQFEGIFLNENLFILLQSYDLKTLKKFCSILIDKSMMFLIRNIVYRETEREKKNCHPQTQSPVSFIRFSSLRKIIIDFCFVLDAQQTFCWLKIKTISGKLMNRVSSEVKTLLSKIKV